MKRLFVLVVCLVGLAARTAFAAHPLITDDTGTQGRGRLQLEFLGAYATDKEGGVRSRGYEAPTTPFLSYGLTDGVDVVLGLPYAAVRTEEAGGTTAARGVTDLSVELKVRFYEKDGLSLAVKPGLSLPTGDEEQGLGNGKTSYGAFLIATKKLESWAFHLNLGYARNEYKLQADKDANHSDIWHVSLATQREVAQDLNVVANIGKERNADRRSNRDPAFALAGLIYAVTENLDIDLGYKAGLNKPEADATVLLGITLSL